MNQVSIIINGVRYDAISLSENEDELYCDNCDLINFCRNIDKSTCGGFTYVCTMINEKGNFKKSDKKFER